jgi:short-subunit dehydrogenase
MNKTILITGATAGIGRDTSVYFAKRGWNVYATGRNIDKIQDLKVHNINVHYLDVQDGASMDKVLAEITKNGHKLDVLVNNAGYAQFGSIEDVPLEMARKQFETNVFGLTEITRKVIPIMRNNQQGRIINVASIAGKVSMPGGGWYAATKYAVEAISDSLRWELKQFNIKVSIIEPGPISSNFGATANEKADFINKDSYYRNFYNLMLNFDELSKIGGTTTDVAKAIWKAANKKRPKIRYKVTFAAKALAVLINLLPTRLMDYFVVRYFSRER